MNEVKVKSNGLRNELKEIHGSINELTKAVIAQTNVLNEIFNNSINPNRMLNDQRDKESRI